MEFTKVNNFTRYTYNKDRMWEVGSKPESAYLLHDHRLPVHAYDEIIIAKVDGKWDAYHCNGILIGRDPVVCNCYGKNRIATATGVIQLLQKHTAQEYKDAVRQKTEEIGVADEN